MLNLHEEGNIGAVKSKIKVLCAQAYSQQREEELRITTPGKESSDSFHFYWNRPERKNGCHPIRFSVILPGVLCRG